MAKKTQTYLLHILGSVLFLSIPILSSPDRESPGLFHIAPFQRDFSTYVLLLAFFYANYVYFIPKLYFSNRRLLFFLAITGCYFTIALLPCFVLGNGRMPSAMPQHEFHHRDYGHHFVPFFRGGSVFQFLLVFFLSFFMRVSQRLATIQSEKLKTEVSYLKAQINPHFLFNTLNSLYALALEKSDAAPEAILKLSAMMRYVVTESSRDIVPLESEIGYLKNYISLQQLRMDGGTPFSFIITGDLTGKRISPMLLIPFIENAFKHGLNPEEDTFIAIAIDVTEKELELSVKNNKVAVAIPLEEKSEQGIENTRQRLEYLYPQKHKLAIFDTDASFEVKLTLTLA
ncbi:hypothetical protein HYN59_02460 [Flavobacterium album]|uniref:Signal transduction histidine kinase internal region domain-containing protein n=1 Tax=Flavobacterium album TaxID=2175091 RepID=A0A2S1QUV7_9FLAO|nr:histidine kinase [Flavobacterium album]AWH84041.1 hypothetical protein HYN59_02460 [Flavobacterium album]